jgi:hypothetical protein
LVRPLLKSEDPEIRKTAIRFIAEGSQAILNSVPFNDEERQMDRHLIESVRNDLSLSCQDTDMDVRMAAARALASLERTR